MPLELTLLLGICNVAAGKCHSFCFFHMPAHKNILIHLYSYHFCCSRAKLLVVILY
ncbi:hypothetical protein CDL12_26459 [Handroanthus impetiginosus]|uniref:Uncharacterized protein n=1 Tax=Handroanthus impetiginosus TaxID=429701 RepID=A0A2G9G7A1_9LAMI|nr:hypothetical protein CDL12_26459 [Handroanthus impetiginosus]